MNSELLKKGGVEFIKNMSIGKMMSTFLSDFFGPGTLGPVYFRVRYSFFMLFDLCTTLRERICVKI